MRGEGWSCGVSASEYLQLYTGAQIYLGDLTPYLTYGSGSDGESEGPQHGRGADDEGHTEGQVQPFYIIRILG
jgi:hypothetical protein